MAIRVQLSTVWCISRGAILTRQPASALLVAPHFVDATVGQLVGTLVAMVADVPAPFRGNAIALITAGLMSLAFMGFSGLVKL